MDHSTVVARGTIKPDGSLEMLGPLALPPGPVEVTIRAIHAPEVISRDWWTSLRAARARREAGGYRFRSEEEINAEIEDLRSGDERLDKVDDEIEPRRQRPDRPMPC